MKKNTYSVPNYGNNGPMSRLVQIAKESGSSGDKASKEGNEEVSINGELFRIAWRSETVVVLEKRKEKER